MFLVVTKIFIALHISNWNTDHKNEAIQNSLLKKLDIELQSNIYRLNFMSVKFETIF
ncbi:DUF6090 family protein [Psychroserpens burtonensis]|uniref:DUF6090 family protein n=1 Tax=Psychroserpens burtonensis TaxID=49278 RepID=UPI0036F20600